jgi:hypothetical protein
VYNPVVLRPIFQRAMRVISSITNANPVVITTTTPHQYIDGLFVRIVLPTGFGMQELNGREGEVTVLSDTTFSMKIDTTKMDPFLSLINLGTTDGTGSIAGTITTNLIRFSIGQSFFIGSEMCLIISDSGSMYCNETGLGTFDIYNGNYSITASPANTTVYFNEVVYPNGLQYAQVVPTGERSEMLSGATYNVLKSDFYQ